MPNSKISRRTTEAQAQKKWHPPKGVLAELVAAAGERVAGLRREAASLRSRAGAAPIGPPFAAALRGALVSIVAEVKRASPSRGPINPGLDVGRQCAEYERAGAAAISILTEPTRFSASIDDLERARAACSLPLLRKDFIVDELQLLEARIAGASAVLLIVRALDPARLRDLGAAAAGLGLEALLEIGTQGELETALSMHATLIGANNRDLETLAMDDVAARLVPLIPRDRVAVAESGYRNAADITRAADAGADAVLIGSELSASGNPSDALRALTSVQRRRNDRPN